MTAPIRSILVTGAGGNLGRKLIAGLVGQDWCERIVALDRTVPPAESRGLAKVRWVEGDLGRPDGSGLREAFAGVDAVVHFAAQNPYPDAPWTDACASFDMTLNMLAAAAQARARRVVFASSNHVMGQYKDAPLADGLAPGGLTTSLPPGPGTRWFNGREVVQGVAYATSKLMGERACLAEARRSGGALTGVCIRIGWCQPGRTGPRRSTPPACPARRSHRP
ncbi:NAD-dependent epimerase/dehydratase family protein [Microvirga aerilata]|uniref:NAD-dependent epimerase/dehydratase family protein n=1 Tax=Microvirga aerilata TaxID=670292 RepID=UPI0036407277